MDGRRCVQILFVGISFAIFLKDVSGTRFVIDRKECFSHSVPHVGNSVDVSFVVMKGDDAWRHSDDGVDLVVKGPSEEQIHNSYDQITQKFDFTVHKPGIYSFCFYNKSPYHELVDFDLHVSHVAYINEHAKDEHFSPLLEQISILEEDLYKIIFEQHWLQANTDRQALVNEHMTKRVIHKAMIESFALVAASVLQVYLLRRLFDGKLSTCRV